MPVVLGRTNTLWCSAGSDDGTGSTSDTTRSIKEWFYSQTPQSVAMVAKLVSKEGQVEYYCAADERVRIGSLAGELIIQNLTLEVLGSYTCIFTGLETRIFELCIRGRSNWFHNL